MLLLVAAAGDRLARIGLVLDAPQARAHRGSKRKIRVRIGRGDAVLDARRFRRGRNDTQRAGAVLDAPGRDGRRPEAGDQPAIGIHRRGDHAQQLGHQRLLAADELAEGPAHAVRRLVVEEHRLAVLPQRHVHVAAAAGPVLRPLGHEGGEPVALLRQHLGEELEQGGAVGRLQPLGDPQRRLEHTGASLGVHALDAHVHGLAHGQQVAVPVAQHRVAQHRIAEEAGRYGLQILVALLADRVRGLGEHEELVLETDLDLEAHPVGALDHPPQHGPRTERLGWPGELAQEQEVARLGRDLSAGLRQDADVGVGIGGVPAGVGDVVVELVVAVPAQHHVAEAHAALEGRLELVDMEVLPAQHPVEVVHPHLDVAEAALLDDLKGIGSRLHLARFHYFSPARGPQTSGGWTLEARGQRTHVAIRLSPRLSFGVAATAPSTRARVYAVFRSSDFGHAGRQWRAFHLVVLAAGLLAVALSSVEGLPPLVDRVLTTIVEVVAIMFSVEYVIRLWTAPESARFAGLSDGTARLRWALSGNGLIGLLAVVPIAAVSSGTIHADSDAVPIFCVLWILKLSVHAPAMNTVARVIANERASLASVLIIFIMVLVTAATLTHLLERHVQPQLFGSIPDALWWAVVTLTTTGYGDVVPHTVGGKMIGSVVMVSGILVLALMTGILATGFAEEER